MRKIIVSCLLAAGLVSCNLDRLNPSGNIISENREVSGFSSVSVRDGLRLHIKNSDVQSLTVTADDNIVPYIETYVNDGKLFARIKGNLWIRGKVSLDVYVEAPALTSATAADGSQVIIGGTFGAGDFSVALSDGSRMTGGALALSGKLTADLTDGSNMDVEGSCTTLKLDLSDGSRFEGSDFRSVDADVKASDGSHASVYASGNLTVRATDGSFVAYYGNPENKDLSSSGGSKIENRSK